MALTETRPDTPARAASATRPATSVDGLLGTGDHKVVGRLFIGGGIVGLIGALVLGVVAVAFANNYDNPAADAFDYLPQIWSMSRDLAVFGGLVPILVGLGVYLVPLQVGAPSLAFPRGAAGAVWTWFLGTDFLILAYLLNGGPGGGRRDFVVLWAASLAMMIGALLWALVCVAATILGARTQGMSLDKVPFTTWSFLVFALIGLVSLPVVVGELLLAFLRIRYLHLPISESAQLAGVGDSVNLAPALYWLAIPVLGMAADIIGVHTERPVRMRKPMMGAIGLFGILAFGPPLVGMASVRPVDFDNAFLVIALVGAVLPVLAVLGLAGDSLRLGRFVPRTALIGALLSGLLLLLAAVVALLAIIEPVQSFLDDLFPDRIDMTQTLILNGTRFHEGIRALVVGAVLVALIAALHHWSTKIWGRKMTEPLGIVALLATAAGAVILAAGEIAAGVDDQPWLPARATDDYASGLAAVSLIGAIVLAAGAVVLGANMAMSFLGTKPAGSSPNPWSGTTLEWATPSPPPVGNFPAPPIVHSATPLADGELQYALVAGTDAEAVAGPESAVDAGDGEGSEAAADEAADSDGGDDR
ncbi:MAG: cbb3-type cytochrome c oxidase subunit I [Acidimicrobiia bacterium]|nr:cbb3-type cytochrome c oxidase subunit I [Acidimicrobiia bacterium]